MVFQSNCLPLYLVSKNVWFLSRTSKQYIVKSLWEKYSLVRLRSKCYLKTLTLSGTGQGIFTHLNLLDQILKADFLFKIFQTSLEVKIEINRVILTPCPSHWVLQKLPLGRSKDEHFSCLLIPFQTGLRHFIFLLSSYHASAYHTCNLIFFSREKW